jgi:S-adenosylmethionine decarboxylase
MSPAPAPDIFRQRLLLEGYYQTEVNEPEIRAYFAGLLKELNLRAYGEPIIFSPSSGMGSGENAGYDAFIPLIDSGISLYIWSRKRFFSCIIYTCKGFNAEAARRFTREFFKCSDEPYQMAF